MLPGGGCSHWCAAFAALAVCVRAADFWGNNACWTETGNDGLRRNYVWCCLSFAKEYLGHPDCWSEDDTDHLSYAECCLIPAEQAAGAKADPGQLVHEQEQEQESMQLPTASVGAITLGFVETLAGRLHLNFWHPRLAHLSVLRGCETSAWDEVLFAVKVKGGCLCCSTPPADLERYLNLPDGCIVGRLLLALTGFMAAAEEDIGRPPMHAQNAREEALGLLQVVEFAVREELLRPIAADPEAGLETTFFDLVGITPPQIRYTLLHTSLQDDYTPVFDYITGKHGSPRLTMPLVFDLGMSGGMDSLFYLTHGFAVVAVEANPLMCLDVRSALRRFGSTLRVLTAAIVSDEDFAHMMDPRQMQGAEVEFHIHKSRPDFSALDRARVPAHEYAGTLPVRAITCAGLVATYGAPYGVKIDAEGADVACLKSLARTGAVPHYLSTELPNVFKGESSAAFDLVILLGSMGYGEFKLCRQSIYNARTVLTVNQDTNLSDLISSRQGLGLGASGLFGEAAVDYIAGPRWRPASAILAELVEGGPIWVAGTMQEWFDLHARQS